MLTHPLIQFERMLSRQKEEDRAYYEHKMEEAHIRRNFVNAIEENRQLAYWFLEERKADRPGSTKYIEHLVSSLGTEQPDLSQFLPCYCNLKAAK